MKISVNQIISTYPYYGCIVKLSEMLFGHEVSLYNLEKLNIIFDTDDYSDKELNLFDWKCAADKLGLQTQKRSRIDGKVFPDVSGMFTEDPIGDAVGFYACEGPEFFIEGGVLIEQKLWSKTDNPDYYSMALTHFREWCFYPTWSEKNEDPPYVRE